MKQSNNLAVVINCKEDQHAGKITLLNSQNGSPIYHSHSRDGKSRPSHVSRLNTNSQRPAVPVSVSSVFHFQRIETRRSLPIHTWSLIAQIRFERRRRPAHMNGVLPTRSKSSVQSSSRCEYRRFSLHTAVSCLSRCGDVNFVERIECKAQMLLI